MEKNKLLINNGLLLYDNNNILKGYSIYIEDSFIIEIGKTEDLTQKYPKISKHNNHGNNIEYIEAEGNLIIPGLINNHMHFYSTFARGIPLNIEPNKDFEDILSKLWWKLDKILDEEEIYYSALIPLIAGIKNGTTSFIDHHSSPNAIEGSLEIIANCMNKLHIKGAVCYEVSDRDGKDTSKKGINENLNFIEKNNKNENSNIKGMFGLHAAFTLDEDTLKEIQSYNIDCGFHIHTSEDKIDNIKNKEKYNLTAVERLHKYGITGEKSLFAHCNHITKNDIQILLKTNTNIIHNPQSNMNNAVGTADVVNYLQEGLMVGLGTDGMTTNMFNAVNFANLIQKHNRADSNVGFMESKKLLMENNPLIASKILGEKIGKIKEGYKADIIIIDYKPYTIINDDNFWAHMLFGIVPSGRVKTTISNGKILMKNYELINIDEAEINKKAEELTQKLWNRFVK